MYISVISYNEHFAQQIIAKHFSHRYFIQLVLALTNPIPNSNPNFTDLNSPLLSLILALTLVNHNLKAVAILPSTAIYPERLFCRELFVIGQF